MRTRRLLAALGAAALVALPACEASDDRALAPLPVADRAVPAASAPPARLCEAIPGHAVAAATGRSPVTADGAGTQCSWRTPTGAEGQDLVLQGSFIDARSYELGRPVEGADAVTGLGDDAYLVRPHDAPPTIYVRDGSVAFALWLSEPGAGAENTLADLARRVLAS